MPAPSLAPVPDDQSSLAALRDRLAALEPRSRPVDGGFGPAWPGLDPRLGQLRRDALHEVRAAEPRHAVAAAAPDGTSAAETRWRIRPAPST
ncbi:MAG: hypothetical protein ACK5DK_09155, partial [Brevundimonas sp.]|uniref:hypothetical protein n=1 Tax=Brevundimonas sp. TaxID=1871086 RepID=UPI00391D1B64